MCIPQNFIHIGRHEHCYMTGQDLTDRHFCNLQQYQKTILSDNETEIEMKNNSPPTVGQVLVANNFYIVFVLTCCFC